MKKTNIFKSLFRKRTKTRKQSIALTGDCKLSFIDMSMNEQLNINIKCDRLSTGMTVIYNGVHYRIVEIVYSIDVRRWYVYCKSYAVLEQSAAITSINNEAGKADKRILKILKLAYRDKVSYEVVCTALQYMHNEPTHSIYEAMQYAADMYLHAE